MIIVYLFALQVFSIAYSPEVNSDDHEHVNHKTSLFVESVTNVHPEFSKKPKIHMLVHLFDHMTDFGPAVGFATERYYSTKTEQ